MMVIFGPLRGLFVRASLVYKATTQMTSAHLTNRIYAINATLITMKQTGGW